MNLLIHDLNEEEYKKIAKYYEDWEVISDNGSIKPCAGCFGCWIKKPGECVIRDGYQNMGELIHRAGKVVIMSRYTYGGLSGFVKNVLDRSIGYVLPFFEIVDGEMHHASRYKDEKAITFIFRGNGLTDNEKSVSKEYVAAVCRNLHIKVEEVLFEECEEWISDTAEERSITCDGNKTILLNCSLRGEQANTKRVLDRLSVMLHVPFEQINIGSFINRPEELMEKLDNAYTIVLGMPLYVDGIPSAPLRLMEWIEQSGRKGNKKIYVVANMGFYESHQIKNLLGMVRMWCEKCGYEYSGGVAIGAGEMIANLLSGKKAEKGPAASTVKGLRSLAGAIDCSCRTEDLYVDPNKFPRSLYILFGNMSWLYAAKVNGLKKKDLSRCSPL